LVNALITEAIRQGSEWVINIDADEFIEGPVIDTLNYAESLRVDVLMVDSYTYRISDKDNMSISNPIIRMTCKEAKSVNKKILCRAEGFVSIGIGNHCAKYKEKESCFYRDSRVLLKHYPYRSFNQYALKVINGMERYLVSYFGKKDVLNTFMDHWRTPYAIYKEKGFEGLREYFEKNIVLSQFNDKCETIKN
jgi:hypothetical protein